MAMIIMMTHDKDEKVIVLWAGDGLVTLETGAINSHTAYVIVWGTLHKFWNWHSWPRWLYRAWLCVILDILTDTRLVHPICIVINICVTIVTVECHYNSAGYGHGDDHDYYNDDGVNEMHFENGISKAPFSPQFQRDNTDIMIGIMADDGPVISETGSLSVMVRTWSDEVLWMEFADGIHDDVVVDDE